MSVPWWGWVVIWGSLTLALVGVLALSAVLLFRKGMRLLDEVSELADRAELLDIPEAELPAPAVAVLADLRDIHAREDARRYHRTERRHERHRRRMSRARRITALDASAQQWPTDWYAPGGHSVRKRKPKG